MGCCEQLWRDIEVSARLESSMLRRTCSSWGGILAGQGMAGYMVEGRKSPSLWNFHLRHLEISGWRGFHLLRKAVAVFLFELCSNPLSINRGVLDSVCRCQLHPCIRHQAPSVFLEHPGSPCIGFLLGSSLLLGKRALGPTFPAKQSVLVSHWLLFLRIPLTQFPQLVFPSLFTKLGTHLKYHPVRSDKTFSPLIVGSECF